MEKYNELTLFWPTNTPTSSHLQERWKEWETRVGRVKNGPALLPGLLEFGDVRNLSPWSLGEECSVVFSSHVDRSIASWARDHKDNGAHPRSKIGAIFAEILRIRFAASVSPWSICIFLSTWFVCDYESSTQNHDVVLCCTLSWHAPNKLVTGTDPYVGYCIPHTDQYHTMRIIISCLSLHFLWRQ